MNAQIIRDAINYAARNEHAAGSTATESLLAYAHMATDDQLVRFAQIMVSASDGSERLVAPPMNSAELSFANID